MRPRSKTIKIGRNFDFHSLFDKGNAFLRELDVYLYSTMYDDEDLVILFDGYEGTGKSKVMRVVAQYCINKVRSWGFKVPNLSIDNIHFDLESYVKTAETMNKNKVKGWVNILDESRMIANRKSSMSKSAVAFTNYMSECRSSNQIHFIALPAFHDIDSYIAIWRQKFVVHLEKKYIDNEDEKLDIDSVLTRGYFKIFADQRKLTHCYFHKVKYTYPKSPDFNGKFSSILRYADPLPNLKEYEEKKAKFRLSKYGDGENEAAPRNQTEHKITYGRNRAILKLIDEDDMSQTKVADLFGLTQPTVCKIYNELKSNK